jgi:restriction system protein
MAVWGVRAGRHGESESYAIDNNVVVIGWDELGDVGMCDAREQIAELIRDAYTDVKPTTLPIWTGEVWAFKDRIKEGDIVVLPLKTRSALAIGRISGPYSYNEHAPPGAYHQRKVTWLRTDLPRTEVDQDLLFSLGAVLAVFQIRRANAEARLLEIAEGKQPPPPGPDAEGVVSPEATPIDLDEYARDQVSSYLGRKFRGHDLARLVAGILIAQGYKVQVSPAGPDGGVDIVAGQGALGFDAPRMAVQVKSSDSPADVGVLRELQGVMPAFGADSGLIVSWGGFREGLIREARRLFFSIRLWDAGEIVTALQEVYDRLPAELKAEIPLRRIWYIAPDESA